MTDHPTPLEWLLTAEIPADQERLPDDARAAFISGLVRGGVDVTDRGQLNAIVTAVTIVGQVVAGVDHTPEAYMYTFDGLMETIYGLASE